MEENETKRNPATIRENENLGGGFKHFFIFTPKIGEMIQFDEHIFQMGWFNHQLETSFVSPSSRKVTLPRLWGL